MTIPAVVLKSKFVMPSSSEYNDYISYIDREDAKMQLKINRDSNEPDDFAFFHSYMDYMDDVKKQGALFTINKNDLSKNEKKNLKKRFKRAQENESPMWQDVISFDNAWLEEQGIYNSKTKEVDEEKLKDVVRGTMDTLLKSERMEESALWTASIHYNTDNIHVHIATVEPNPTRKKMRFFNKKKGEWVEQYRAKRKQGTLDKMKSRVANQILDRTEDFNKIDEYIRGTVRFKKENGVNLSSHKKTEKLFMHALMLLPDNISQWKYGYHTIDKARPYIDEIVDIYINTYHKHNMKKLDKLLDKQVDISKRLFGEDSRHKQYKQTKLKDLKKRMGNAVLTEMRQYAIRERNARYQTHKHKRRGKNHRFNNWKTGNGINVAVMRLNYVMRKTYHDYERERLIEEYDRMMGYDR